MNTRRRHPILGLFKSMTITHEKGEDAELRVGLKLIDTVARLGEQVINIDWDLQRSTVRHLESMPHVSLGSYGRFVEDLIDVFAAAAEGVHRAVARREASTKGRPS